MVIFGKLVGSLAFLDEQNQNFNFKSVSTRPARLSLFKWGLLFVNDPSANRNVGPRTSVAPHPRAPYIPE
jgi:hypothetical protein